MRFISVFAVTCSLTLMLNGCKNRSSNTLNDSGKQELFDVYIGGELPNKGILVVEKNGDKTLKIAGETINFTTLENDQGDPTIERAYTNHKTGFLTKGKGESFRVQTLDGQSFKTESGLTKTLPSIELKKVGKTSSINPIILTGMYMSKDKAHTLLYDGYKFTVKGVKKDSVFNLSDDTWDVNASSSSLSIFKDGAPTLIIEHKDAFIVSYNFDQSGETISVGSKLERLADYP